MPQKFPFKVEEYKKMLRTCKWQQATWIYENLPQGFLVLEKRGMAVGFEQKEKIALAKVGIH